MSTFAVALPCSASSDGANSPYADPVGKLIDSDPFDSRIFAKGGANGERRIFFASFMKLSRASARCCAVYQHSRSGPDRHRCVDDPATSAVLPAWRCTVITTIGYAHSPDGSSSCATSFVYVCHGIGDQPSAVCTLPTAGPNVGRLSVRGVAHRSLVSGGGRAWFGE